MKKDNSLRMRCFLLAFIYSVSFMCYNSFFKKKSYYPVEDYKSSNVVYDISDEIGDELFIGTESEVYDEYEKDCNKYLAYVIDKRNYNDPFFQIYNSYLINDKDTMFKIINGLIDYEKEYPSRWDRTADSMFIEWCVHNMCYYLDIEVDRTRDVDLDNDDETLYNKKVLTMIAKNHR